MVFIVETLIKIKLITGILIVSVCFCSRPQSINYLAVNVLLRYKTHRRKLRMFNHLLYIGGKKSNGT